MSLKVWLIKISIRSRNKNYWPNKNNNKTSLKLLSKMGWKFKHSKKLLINLKWKELNNKWHLNQETLLLVSRLPILLGLRSILLTQPSVKNLLPSRKLHKNLKWKKCKENNKKWLWKSLPLAGLEARKPTKLPKKSLLSSKAFGLLWRPKIKIMI